MKPYRSVLVAMKHRILPFLALLAFTSLRAQNTQPEWSTIQAQVFQADTATYNEQKIGVLRLSQTGTLQVSLRGTLRPAENIQLLSLRSYTTDSAGNHLLYGIKSMGKAVELYLDGPHELMETYADGKITLKHVINTGTFHFSTEARALAFSDALMALRKKLSPYQGNPRNKWGQ